MFSLSDKWKQEILMLHNLTFSSWVPTSLQFSLRSCSVLMGWLNLGGAFPIWQQWIVQNPNGETCSSAKPHALTWLKSPEQHITSPAAPATGMVATRDGKNRSSKLLDCPLCRWPGFSWRQPCLSVINAGVGLFLKALMCKSLCLVLLIAEYGIKRDRSLFTG